MIHFRIASGPARFWLGVAGLLTAAAAVATDSRLAGWAAVALLAVAAASRMAASRRRRSTGDGPAP